MKGLFYTYCCLLVLTFTLSCKGQSSNLEANESIIVPNATHLIGDTVAQLDQNIWTVFQDSRYHYWFLTDGQGVYHYDGKTILHYSSKHGLPNDRIRSIQEDDQGNIYIVSLNGVTQFNGQKFTTLPVVESNDWRLDSKDLWFCILGKTGEYGPYRFDGKTLHHLKFPKHYMEEEYYASNGKHPWSPYEPYTIYKDKAGNIWFGTSELGLCRYDGKTINWMYEKHLTLIEGGGSFGIRSIIEDKEGKFWICNTNYRYDILPTSPDDKDPSRIKYNREKGIENLITTRGKDHIYFMSSCRDDNGDLWLLTYQEGVWHYDGEKVTQYPVKFGDKNVTLFSIYKDKKGQLWLGSHEEGVFKFNGKSFEKYKP